MFKQQRPSWFTVAWWLIVVIEVVAAVARDLKPCLNCY